MFWRRCATWLVAGMAQVTAGCADHELQRHLRPAVAVDLGSPARQCGVAAAACSRPAFAERAVGEHRDAALARQRQDALLDLAIQQVVADLDKVDRLRGQDAFDLGVAPSFAEVVTPT
jgi:hypothetical protein